MTNLKKRLVRRDKRGASVAIEGVQRELPYITHTTEDNESNRFRSHRRLIWS